MHSELALSGHTEHVTIFLYAGLCGTITHSGVCKPPFDLVCEVGRISVQGVVDLEQFHAVFGREGPNVDLVF